MPPGSILTNGRWLHESTFFKLQCEVVAKTSRWSLGRHLGWLIKEAEKFNRGPHLARRNAMETGLRSRLQKLRRVHV
jgi:hypothetical protein